MKSEYKRENVTLKSSHTSENNTHTHTSSKNYSSEGCQYVYAVSKLTKTSLNIHEIAQYVVHC